MTLLVQAQSANLTFMIVVPNRPLSFAVKDGEIVNANYNLQALEIEIDKADPEIILFLNHAESFAIPFAAGVAADEIGFQETASTFCRGITACMPAIWYLKQTQSVRFPSVLRLYSVWGNRMAAQAMAPLINNMQAVIDAAKNQIIPNI